jgi:hypothetical protein
VILILANLIISMLSDPTTNSMIRFFSFLLLALTLISCTELNRPTKESFSLPDPAIMVTTKEAHQWARAKNANLPTLPGSPEWHNFAGFLETKLKAFDLVDIKRNVWTFNRWHTSDDSRDWSLVSDGRKVKVAYYGAYSGSTGTEGITEELIYYDHDNPPSSIKEKIVVIPTRAQPLTPFSEQYLQLGTFNDYEYRSDTETFPPIFEFVDPGTTFTFDIYYQMRQKLYEIAIEGEAAGLIIVYNMSFDRTDGMYSFTVPQLYDVPTLTLNRVEGAKLIADAKEGKIRTLHLEANVEPAEIYQLVGHLPSKDYDTDQDEQILLVAHTAGPSIAQGNGALGILAIIKYFSQMPQADRHRTLTVYLDCRHYLPGLESAFVDVSYFNRYPKAIEPIVAMLALEHLGEKEYREEGEKVIATGLAEQSYLCTRNNDLLIKEAISAVKNFGWSRVQVAVPERPGFNDGTQEYWWGVGTFAKRDKCGMFRCWDIPGYAMAGNLGYYWTSRSDIERWDQDLFHAQAATMARLTGFLMATPLPDFQPGVIKLQSISPDL